MIYTYPFFTSPRDKYGLEHGGQCNLDHSIYELQRKKGGKENNSTSFFLSTKHAKRITLDTLHTRCYAAAFQSLGIPLQQKAPLSSDSNNKKDKADSHPLRVKVAYRLSLPDTNMAKKPLILWRFFVKMRCKCGHLG